MNAAPLLHRIARALADCRLEAVLVGNAAAALQGATVTTLAFDFMFRKARLNVKKLKAFAAALGATIFKPYYPASDLYRVVNDDLGLQCDFLARLHGVRSFAGLRSRATRVTFGGCSILVADLRDVVRSKRAAGRPRDLAVLDLLEQVLHKKEAAQEEGNQRPAQGE